MKNNGLLVINASAGSGKTYALARNYIFLLLFCRDKEQRLQLRKQPNYHRHILAITFTNKATGEMKQRIIEELEELAHNTTKSDFYRDFAQDREEHPEQWGDQTLDPQQLAQAAQNALAGILHNYAAFNVSTIDAFFQSVLRNFARELDRDYNYEVQIDSKFAINQAVHNFLISLGTDLRRIGKDNRYRFSDIEQWVRDYLHSTIEDERPWNIFRDDSNLHKFAEKITDETFLEQMPSIRAYLFKDDNQPDFGKIRAFRLHVLKAAKEHTEAYKAQRAALHEILNRHGIDEQRLSGSKSLMQLLKTTKIEDGDKPGDGFFTITRDNVESQFKKGPALPGEALDEVAGWCGETANHYLLGSIFTQLSQQLGLLGLLGQIDRHLHQYCRDTNSLLIADSNDLIAHVLDSGVPFIYERIGTWLNHYMIDEFQDTSKKQYRNFLPLLEEALAQDHDNLCLLIGDPKQSIYRFRNADPSIFRDKVEQDFTPQRHNLEQQTLKYNFRSCRNIIRFNNHITELLLNDFPDLPTLQRTYDPKNDKTGYEQQIPEKAMSQPEGYVRINVANTEGKPFDNNEVLLSLPQYLLELHERFPWRAIGVLVNKKDEGYKIINRILAHNKTAPPEETIPCVSEESLLVVSSPSVRRIVGLLQFIDLTQMNTEEPDDSGESTAPPADKAVIYAQARQLSQQRLCQVLGLFLDKLPNLGQDQDAGSLLAGCFRQYDTITGTSTEEQLRHYAETLQSLLPDSRSELLTLNNIVDRLINNISPAAAQNDTAYLLAFQDLVQDFSTRQSAATVREFLRFWDKQKDKLTIPPSPEKDAITIMTIHKSKGLEFPCVVIPMLTWELDGESRKAKTEPYWITRKEWNDQGGNLILPLPPEVEIPPLLPLNKSNLNLLRNVTGTFRTFVDDYNEAVCTDNFNKTYVAFTRAVEELHMTCVKGNNVSEHITGHIASDPLLTLSADNTYYYYGQPRTAPFSAKPSDPVITDEIQSRRLQRGVNRVTVRLPQDLTDKQNTGTRLHNLLSRIRYRADLDRAWQFCLNRGIISNDDATWPAERVWDVVSGMFSDPRMALWWADDNEVYNERPIVGLPDGTALRPDRVVRTADGRWIVVDYKFGQEITERHAEQVGRYCDMLTKMGHDNVEGYVWYVEHDRVAEVVNGQFTWN